VPAQYEAIRDKLAKTMSMPAAKKHAAMIYNSKHGDNPVGPHSDAKDSKSSGRKKVAAALAKKVSPGYGNAGGGAVGG
jgi:hypothetical protein